MITDSIYVGDHHGLSSLPDHYVERSRCLNDFKAMYGGKLPLSYATFVMGNMLVTRRVNHTRLSVYHNLTQSLESRNALLSKRKEQLQNYPALHNQSHSYLQRHPNIQNSFRKLRNSSYNHKQLGAFHGYPLKAKNVT